MVEAGAVFPCRVLRRVGQSVTLFGCYRVQKKKPAFWRVGYLQRIYLHRLRTVARNERMVDVSGESDLGIAKPEIRIFIWISVRN